MTEPWRAVAAQQELARLGDEAIAQAKDALERAGSHDKYAERAQAWALIAQAYYIAAQVRVVLPRE